MNHCATHILRRLPRHTRTCIAQRTFLSPVHNCHETNHKLPYSSASAFASENAATSSVDAKEASFFGKMSDQWWNKTGDFRALQALNELRVPFISDAYIAYGLRGPSQSSQRALRQNSPFPLRNIKILDVGCGGGLLSEPLARLGATVTGIDMVEESIRTAEQHWETVKNPTSTQGDIEYLHGTIEELALTRAGDFDVVVCSEVVEHVSDVASFVASVSQLTRPGGVTVFSTINRTICSFAGAIVAAEYLLRLVPRGTHHHGKFVTPEELESFLRNNGFTVRMKHGALYNPIIRRWTCSAFDAVNYFVAAVKAEDAADQSR
ncbi:putative Ubiquinone biosynthesis O-methyltransferase, mitochondrial [Hypsibius exemplaris]|uniref:Ubiquinone biosynthesis O-methyltransferase, mitochondrial n=1 Tax=Hypsibius exemplaris TaxID=2072580 RepID=A0A1W0WF21_HYPEX|nr:putative Ubiquinone biosynthesis O-methyltransferase, mitochondrial [Hypsibius exemplaris]